MPESLLKERTVINIHQRNYTFNRDGINGVHTIFQYYPRKLKYYKRPA